MNKYPIYFLDNETCVSCGHNSIRFYDEKNEPCSPTSKNNTTYYGRCKKCGAEYFLIYYPENNCYRVSSKDNTIKNFEERYKEGKSTRLIDCYI